jgi:hypothetical protein
MDALCFFLRSSFDGFPEFSNLRAYLLGFDVQIRCVKCATLRKMFKFLQHLQIELTGGEIGVSSPQSSADQSYG